MGGGSQGREDTGRVRERFIMEVAFEMNMGGVYQVVKWGRASRKRKQYKESVGGMKENWIGVQEMG